MLPSIFVEDAEVLSQERCPGEQYVLRLNAPRCAQAALPGNFVHLTCGPALPMRRPFSIMRASPAQGWVEILYKRLGAGTAMLAERIPGERLSVMGPIGVPFSPRPDRTRAILIGGGVGIPPVIFLAETLMANKAFKPLVLMGSEVPFPFKARASQFLVPGMPAGTIAALPLLEDLGVPSRLASLQGYAGCHEGYVTEIARLHLDALTAAERNQVALYACGPHAMLEASAQLAREYALPAQVCVEEYMACATGGCAGCAVSIMTPQGVAMKRVCIDGPVFEAEQVFFS